MSDTPNDAETMTDVVRRIAKRELDIIDSKENPVSEDDLDRLAKIALVLQRVRTNDRVPTTKDGEEPSDEQLMRKAG